VQAGDFRPMSSGEILNVALKIYRRRFGVMARLVAIFVIPVEIIAGLLRAITVRESTTAGGTTHLSGSAGGAFFGSIAASLLLGLAIQLASAASLKAVSDAYLGHPSDWRESFSFVWQRLAQVVVVGLMVLVLSSIGLLLVLPGVYLWIIWLVAMPALLIEGQTGFAALRRSRELVAGRWWATFGTYVLAYVFALIVNLVIGTIIGAAFSSASGRAAQGVAIAIGDVASAVVTTPFVAAVVALLYFDLRHRREGFGSAGLAAGVGIDPSRTPQQGSTPWLGTPEPPYPEAGRDPWR